MSYELEPFGLHLILIEPGIYRTEIWESSPPPHTTRQRLPRVVATGLGGGRRARR
jgi:hypothetical protein